MYQTINTFHAVDDQAVSPAEALLIFVDTFAFPLTLTKMIGGGQEAHFTLSQNQDPENYASRARRIVKCLRMPFEVDLVIKTVGVIVLESKLVLKFTGA